MNSKTNLNWKEVHRQYLRLSHQLRAAIKQQISPEPVVQWAFWIGLVVIAITLFLILRIFIMRARHAAEGERRQRFLSTWETLLQRSVLFDASPSSLPRINVSEAYMLLSIWQHLHETLRGVSKERLNQVARWIGLDEYMRKRVNRGRTQRRVLAVAAMGHLQDSSVWKTLVRFAQSENPILSLVAMRSLVQIDPGKALTLLIPALTQREDWPTSRVAFILQEAGAEKMCRPLISTVLSSPPELQPRIIRYLGVLNCADALTGIRTILAGSQSSEVTSACLQYLGQFREPQDLVRIREYLAHPQWPVRVQAAVALGKMGTLEDEQQLITLLSDGQWWVRYRAAQALAGLPFVSPQRLRMIQAEQSDRFARDILTQVMAEEEIRR